jgi:hypothetical protein
LDHLAFPEAGRWPRLESQPVTTAGALADVADRPAANEVSQLEDLDNSQHRAFCRVLLPRTTDPARIAGESLVVFHGRSPDRTKQAVRLAAIETDTPWSQRLVRHSLIICVDSSPSGTPPRYGAMCRVKSHECRSTVRIRSPGR